MIRKLRVKSHISIESDKEGGKSVLGVALTTAEDNN